MGVRKPYTNLLFLLVLLLFYTSVVGQNYLLESFDAEVFPPEGWSQTQLSGTGLWDRRTTGGNPSCSPRSGDGMIRYFCFGFSEGTSAIIISPSINLTGVENHKFQFWMYRDGNLPSYLDAVYAYVNTTNSINGAYHLGTVFRPMSAEPVVLQEGWYKYDFEIPSSFNGPSNYFFLKATSNYDFGANIFVDDVRVYVPVGANAAPINFNASNITKNGMTIFWGDNSTNEEGFRVYISTDDVNYNQYGTDIPSTTETEIGEEYSLELTGLLPGTTYYFRIAAFKDIESDFLEGNQTTEPPGLITSLSSGNWNEESTWDSGTVPTSIDNVLITTTHTVIVDANGEFNSLNIDGSLSFQGFTLSGVNLTISSSGIVNVLEGTTAKLSLSGDISNEGEFDFYSSDIVFGNLTFTGTSKQIFDALGVTNIGNITLIKGDSHSYIAEIFANGTFSIKNGATSNFLTLTNGTLKISGTANVSNNVFPSGGYTISSKAGIWINNPNFTVLGQSGSVTNNGLIRISGGTYNVGSFADNVLNAGAGAIVIIDGGTLNLASRFTTSNAIFFTLSSGEINVNLLGNTTSNASFGLLSSFNNITISGGTINLVRGSTGASPLDYHIQGSNISITGGTLNIGNETTPSPYIFRIRGSSPSVNIDNTSNPKTLLLAASTNIYGNININENAILNTQSSTLQIIGNSQHNGDIINNGLITNTSTTGTNRLSFVGIHGTQTLSGIGTLGNVTTPMAGIIFSNPSGVNVLSNIVTNRIELQKGLVSGANLITLGNAGSSEPTVIRGGISTANVGSFDQSPIFNPGISYNVTYSTGLNPYSTGYELPASVNGTIELTANFDVTLTSETSVKKLIFAATNTAKLITTDENLLSINGSDVNDLILVSGNTGYVEGPLVRTLPPSLEQGSAYIFPVGKGSPNFFELLNPTTTADGLVYVKVEVFDESTGGNAGVNIKDGSLESRYWKSETLSGINNFINTSIRVTQASPPLTTESGLALSSDLTGNYNLISFEQPVGNTLTSDIINELGFFAIGLKEISQVYISSTTIQPNTDIVMRGDANQPIIGIEIVTSGNEPALEVTNIDFSSNGTTNVADIAKAKLFYTGNSPSFSTNQQVGTIITSPNTEFSIILSQELLEGTNYFWLTYDIAENATDKNFVDAECKGITIGGSNKIPMVTSPVGNRQIRTYLSGTYLVGVGRDYSTLTSAVNDLNLVGINAPVLLSLMDSDYSSNEAFPIIVNPIKNSNVENFVTLKPASGIFNSISGNSTESLLIINTGNFVIDGSNEINGTTRDLSISNIGTSATSGAINVSNSGSNVTFKNLNVSSGQFNAGYGITLDGINNASVINCKITKALIGIHVKNSSSFISVNGNEIGSLVSAERVHTSGILILNTSNFSLKNNSIIGVSSSTSATSSGIAISGNSLNGEINGNRIRSIKNTRALSTGSNGIWLYSTNNGSNVEIYNNLISDIASVGLDDWSDTRNGYGIVISNGGGYKVYYNTIHLNTDQSSAGGGNTAGINITSAVTAVNSLDIRNNLIISTQTKGTRYAVYCAAPNTVFADINYNNYRAPTGVGFIGGSARTTLANWQTGTGKDANSLNLLPFFTSATDLSLVNNMNCPLDGAGTPVAGITTDFLGVTRNATNPDMGAIEFTTVPFGAPVAEFDEVCYGENSGLLTLTEYEGTITGWESSTSPFGEWSSIANTLNTYTSGSLYENTRFRTLVNNGLCANFATEYVEVAVSPETVGGSVTGGSDICNGQTSGLLTLANHVGDVVRWESSVDPFDTWTPIVNTLTTYTSNALPETTRFRAVVKSGVCDELPSEHTEVIVFPVSFGGTVSGGTTICSGETSSELTLSGNVGDVVRWEYSVNGTDWFAIVNTETTYTSGALTETTHFRAVVQNGPCDEAASEHTTVTVDPPSVGGAVTGGTSVCSGQTSGLLTLSGHTGDIVRWENSVLPFDTWNTIDNTLSTYTSGAITEVTRFRAVVKSGVCSVATSDYTDVTISPPTVGGSVTGGTTICEGETSGVLTLSGHTGDIIKWQSSTNLTDWTDIANTVTTYTSGALAQTTHFRAVVKSGGCDALESSHTTVTVNPIPIAVITTTAPLTYCEEEDISAALTATPAGGTYRWFKNDVVISGATSATFTATSAGSYTAEVTVNECSDLSDAIEIVVNPLPNAAISTSNALTYCEGDAISVTFTAIPAGGTYRWFKNGTVISGATSASYTATSAGNYSAEVTVNGCSDLSDAIEIVVNPLPNAAISTSNALTYCEGDAISVTFTATPAGGTYRWFKDDVLISGATSATYSATSAGNYSAEVTVNGCSDLSDAIDIVVNPLPNAAISTSNALTYCEGDAISVTFTASPAGGTYRWFKDDVLISGATSASYIATSAGNYSAEVTVNGCSGFSNELEILVNPTPIPVVSTVDNLNYCFGDEISVEFTVDISAEAYQWFKNESPIDGETGSTYKATEEGFYSVGVMVNGCPGISNEIEIVVNPLPITSLPTDTVFLPNYESYLFDAGAGFAAYLWFDGSTEQTYLFDGEAWGLGIYEIWVDVTNEFGCTTRDSVTVSVGHVGVSTMESLTANIFPNPNSGRFTISLNGISSKHLRISIFNAMGQAVYTKDYRVNASHFNETINLNEKAKGIYFISISDGKGITTKRIVIE